MLKQAGYLRVTAPWRPSPPQGEACPPQCAASTLSKARWSEEKEKEKNVEEKNCGFSVYQSSGPQTARSQKFTELRMVLFGLSQTSQLMSLYGTHLSLPHSYSSLKEYENVFPSSQIWKRKNNLSF
eukprot:GFUD01051903.1.p1 GENE.GFUD01051903.1~~GFUD01051903.1.p1  ORF type:complete len:126 (-),score=16.26 GFUD01051903.1:87-464(-)